MMGEDLELLEAIVCNDDNLTYGSIITVQELARRRQSLH